MIHRIRQCLRPCVQVRSRLDTDPHPFENDRGDRSTAALEDGVQECAKQRDPPVRGKIEHYHARHPNVAPDLQRVEQQ